MNKFKIGDVVRLKSGSIRMTIDSTDPWDDKKDMYCRCVWWSEAIGKTERDVFVNDCLELQK